MHAAQPTQRVAYGRVLKATRPDPCKSRTWVVRHHSAPSVSILLSLVPHIPPASRTLCSPPFLLQHLLLVCPQSLLVDPALLHPCFAHPSLPLSQAVLLNPHPLCPLFARACRCCSCREWGARPAARGGRRRRGRVPAYAFALHPLSRVSFNYFVHRSR